MFSHSSLAKKRMCGISSYLASTSFTYIFLGNHTIILCLFHINIFRDLKKKIFAIKIVNNNLEVIWGEKKIEK